MLNMHFCGISVRVIARQTASIGPLIITLKTACSVLAIARSLSSPWFGCGLDVVLDARHLAGPERAVFGGPAVVDHLDRNRVVKQSSPTPFLSRDDELHGFEHAQVLHQRDTTGAEARTDLVEI